MPASVQLDEVSNPQFKALCEKIVQLTPKGGFPTKDSPPPPAPPPARLAFYHENHAFIPEGPLKDTYCDFIRAPNGRVTWLRAGRLYEKMSGEA